MRPQVFYLAMLGLVHLGLAGQARAQSVVPLNAAQSTYLERCGGCHGIQGDSAPIAVPRLQGQVAWFLCTARGREYLIQLPSVAKSSLDDDELAQLMNLVVFDLGRTPGVEHYPRFTAEEVGRLRARPLDAVSLVRHRRALVAAAIKQCGAPPALRDYGPPAVR